MTARRPAVKICGIRTEADARLARDAGADYVGLVLAGSPRRVDEETAGRVARAVEIPAVGVFVDRDAEKILALAGEIGFRVAQLHGGEPPEVCRRLRASGLEVWKALRPASREALADLADRYAPDVDALLVEGFSASAAGGTGAGFPHEWLHGVPRAPGRPRLVLAGGLTPEGVAAAVARVRPDVVDVSSGVERRPGEKDPELVRAFVRNVRAAARAVGGPA
ncbi:MAG: phosphoribosylanthranilate isomerase [Gemmatimonadota bacterium]